MKTLKLFLLILTLLNITQAYSMLEKIEPKKSYRIKQLKHIFRLTENTQDPKLIKLRHFTLKAILENPDEQVLELLEKKNIKFKEKNWKQLFQNINIMRILNNQKYYLTIK